MEFGLSFVQLINVHAQRHIIRDFHAWIILGDMYGLVTLNSM
jgi:hypothetical protein